VALYFPAAHAVHAVLVPLPLNAYPALHDDNTHTLDIEPPMGPLLVHCAVAQVPFAPPVLLQFASHDVLPVPDVVLPFWHAVQPVLVAPVPLL
jgi:hypothetical protein